MIHTLRTVLGQATLLGLLCAPLMLHAEGAVRVFNCTISQQCDAAGVCSNASEPVTFRMAPVTLDANGAGQYQLSHGDSRQLPMQALSEIGPFVWSETTSGNGSSNAEQHNTLLISSDTRLLWHTLSLGPTPAATVRFLSCTMQ